MIIEESVAWVPFPGLLGTLQVLFYFIAFYNVHITIVYTIIISRYRMY